MVKSVVLCFGMFFLPSISSSQNPVIEHGQLRVVGHQLCNEKGIPAQLRGMSQFGLMHMPECLSFESFRVLRDDWNSSVIRVPVYMANYSNANNYNQNPAWNDRLIDSCVAWTERLGMYCIIDWHNDRYGSPVDSHHSGAAAFFELVSSKYSGKKNIIYEVFNEPYGTTAPWDTIAEYANRIMPVIRKNDPNAIIIIGCSDWDQKLQSIDTAKLNDNTNVMFAFHFYAASHRSLFPIFAKYIHRIPVFVSEWGVCESSGAGRLDTAVSSQFLQAMKQHIVDNDTVSISWCNFSYGDKDESTSSLKPHSCADGLWNNTTPGGDFVKYWLNNNRSPVMPLPKIKKK